MKKITFLFAAFLFSIIAFASETVTYTVYFDNTSTQWEKVYVYCWTPQNATWPGIEMTEVDGHDGYYYYTAEEAYTNIIFNNGSGTQTVDLDFPSGENNMFTITGESGGKKVGSWSAYVADPNAPSVTFTNLTATAELGTTIKPEALAENIENPTYVYTVAYEGGEAVVVDATMGYVLERYGSYLFTVVVSGDNDASATTTYTVTVEPFAMVCGSSELCNGYYWSENVANAMYLEDGLYTITYTNVPAGSYEFKCVVDNTWLGIGSIDAENSTKGYSGSDNISFTLIESADIKISYNPATQKIILVGVGLEQFAEFVVTSYTLCGSAEIFGEYYNTALTANDMVETSTGVWTKSYSNVALEATTYYYKVAANYSWNVAQYPIGDLLLEITEAGNYNLTFVYEPNKEEGEKLTCTVEKVVEVVEAYVLGTINIASGDNGWDPTIEDHKMTYDESTGIWSKTFTALPAGDYEFKIYYGVWMNSVVADAENSTPGYKYENEGDNISFTLEDATTVTITYNATTNVFTIKAEGLDEFGVMVVTSYTLCGSAEIFGEEKDPTLEANDMIEECENVWTKTYNNVRLEAYNVYLYKVVANHAWNGAAYPSADLYMILKVEEAGEYNLTFVYEPNKTEGYKISCSYEKVEGVITAVENVVIANLFTQDGLIVADGEIQIFTIIGQNVTNMNGNLASGVYVVRTADTAIKVVVE